MSRRFTLQQTHDIVKLKREREKSSLHSLFWIIFATAMAAVTTMTLAKKSSLRYVIDWGLLQLKYNAVAIKSIWEDQIYARRNKTELPQMPNRVAIVTGGSRGIGAEIVRMLLQCDMEVVIACRRPEAGEKCIKTIRESGVKTGTAKVMTLDNSSLDSVRKFAEEFKNNYEKLDILINNAGVMFTPYRETKDGFEEQYGVNYLSHFLLTLLLIPLLKNAGTPDHCARVVNVSSCAHLLGDISLNDVNRKEYFLTGEAYAQSKLAQLMFTKSLTMFFKDKKLPIIANAVHPGVVNTDLFDNSYLTYLRPIGKFFFKNPVQGATTIVFTAVDPQMENKSGLYISNCRDSPINPIGDDKTLQKQLFELSLKQVGLQNILT